MAVDTRNKRFSMLGLAQARMVPYVLPNPDGSFSTQDRAQLAFMYAGIALDAPVNTPRPGAPGSSGYFQRKWTGRDWRW